jgi:hypothetical protein
MLKATAAVTIACLGIISAGGVTGHAQVTQGSKVVIAPEAPVESGSFMQKRRLRPVHLTRHQRRNARAPTSSPPRPVFTTIQEQPVGTSRTIEETHHCRRHRRRRRRILWGRIPRRTRRR